MTERELTKIWAKVTDKIGNSEQTIQNKLNNKQDVPLIIELVKDEGTYTSLIPIVDIVAAHKAGRNIYVKIPMMTSAADLTIELRGVQATGPIALLSFSGTDGTLLYTVIGVRQNDMDAWSISSQKLQGELISGENIKSINGQSVLGAGNLELGELFVVRMTQHNSVYTADKSVSEIYAASYTNGKPVFAVIPDINLPVLFLTDCDPDADSYVFSAIESNVVTTLRWQQTDDYTYELETTLLQPKFTYGSTSDRPILALNNTGYQYFDTDLGKPIYWNGSAWIDSIGTVLS